MDSLLIVAFADPGYDAHRKRGYIDVVIVRPRPDHSLDPYVDGAFDRASVTGVAPDPTAFRQAIDYAISRLTNDGLVEIAAEAVTPAVVRGLDIVEADVPDGTVCVRASTRRRLFRRR